MGLLDDLKRQAEEIKQDGLTRVDTALENTQQVDQKLRMAFKYLNDLGSQLSVVKPTTPRTFDLSTFGRFEGLRLCDFFVDYRTKRLFDKEMFDTIDMTFKQTSDQALTIKRELEPNVNKLQDYLTSSNLRFEIQKFTNERKILTHAIFKIPSEVRSEIKISGDHDKANITFAVRNVEFFGTYSVVFAAADINEHLLEEFAKMLLGQPNTFRTTGNYQTLQRPVPVANLG